MDSRRKPSILGYKWLNRIDKAQECPDIHRGFASLSDRCHENRAMNWA